MKMVWYALYNYHMKFEIERRIFPIQILYKKWIAKIRFAASPWSWVSQNVCLAFVQIFTMYIVTVLVNLLVPVHVSWKISMFQTNGTKFWSNIICVLKQFKEITDAVQPKALVFSDLRMWLNNQVSFFLNRIQILQDLYIHYRYKIPFFIMTLKW